MELDILLRGQSNAFLLASDELRVGAAEVLVREVQRLLGFDGTTDRVVLDANWWTPGQEMIRSSTAFVGDWVARDGNGNWQALGPDQALLSHIAANPRPDAAEIATLWFHSEHDSLNPSLTAAEWESAVRYDAALVRGALGRDAEHSPYVFVSAIPFAGASDQTTQAIRGAMERLAADPAFNGRIGVRALDLDMSFHFPSEANDTAYGAAHISAADSLAIAARLARSLAEEWAEYARPGSPVALAGGDIADAGPRVVAAGLSAPDTLLVRVVHDRTAGFAPLDPDAAAGLGWSVRGAGRVIGVDQVEVVAPNMLRLHLTEPLPADGGFRLFYGYGYGRLAQPNQPGQGNAIYDQEGMPLWTPAEGAAVSATAAAIVPRHDFDGDGRADILWQHDGGLAAIWTMNGTQPAAGVALAPNPGPSWHAVGAYDFDGDGRADILWQHDGGLAAIWTMNGTQPVSAAVLAPDPGPAWRAIDGGDFDGDGRADILWRHEGGQAAVWTMNGAQLATGAVLAPNPGPEWQVRGARDFNGDGRADILWQHAAGQAAIWIMNGAQVAGGDLAGPNPGPTWQVAGVGDFDGDGRADILWRHEGGQAAVWLMDGARIAAGAMLPANPGPAWHAEKILDVNADGRDDILWRHEGGQAAVWLMDGAQLAAGAVLPANPGPAWHIV